MDLVCTEDVMYGGQVFRCWVHFCICFDTKDHPGLYTVRKHYILPPKALRGVSSLVGPLMYTGPSLKQAREKVPAGLVCMNRDPLDDRVVVESWM